MDLDELITPGLVSSELKAASAARREARAALGPDFTPEPSVGEELRSALGSNGAEALLASALEACYRRFNLKFTLRDP